MSVSERATPTRRPAYHRPTDAARRAGKERVTDLTEKRSLLEDLARRLGIDVRYEALGSRGSSVGGMCRLHGREVMLVDAHAPVAEQVGVLLDALSGRDIEAIFVPPTIRSDLERRRG